MQYKCFIRIRKIWSTVKLIENEMYNPENNNLYSIFLCLCPSLAINYAYGPNIILELLSNIES